MERGIQRIAPYNYRHFMATKVRALDEVNVDHGQSSLWLGHGRSDTSSWYEKLDPEHPHERARATSIILEKLDAPTVRALVPMTVKQRKQFAGLTVVSGGKQFISLGSKSPDCTADFREELQCCSHSVCTKHSRVRHQSFNLFRKP
jgi:hypothetical protein